MSKMSRHSVALLSVAVLFCSCQGQFVEFDDSADLPHWIGRGFGRGLLQGKIVTVGYDANAQYKVPTGSKNALSVLQSALNQVGKNGGGTLLIGAGTFLLDGQLKIPVSNIKIQGAGRSRTILKLVDNAAKWKGIGLITGTGLRGITISFLTLDGNRDKQPADEILSYGRYGLYISPNEGLRLNQIAVINFQRYGIDPPARNVKPGVDYSNDKRVTIIVTNSIASNNSYDGFIFDTVVGLYAANNTAENNGRYGFNLCTGTWNAIVDNNFVRNNGFGAAEPKWMYLGGNGCGMMTDTNDLNGATYVSTNVVWSRNTVLQSKRGGFCGKMGKNIKVLNNVITDASQCAWFSRNNGLEITGNNCTKTKSYIINDNNTAVKIANNTCDGVACK